MSDDREDYALRKKKTKINLTLILKQQFGDHALKWDHNKQLEKLNDITHLRLDRLDIGCIDGLELVGSKLTNIYLQYNLIEQIENLEFLTNLTFLTLAHNLITKVEGLRMLPKLGLLDLSRNQINYLDIDEIPKSVVFLNLEGNMCTNLPNYEENLISALPRLKQLDGETVTRLRESDSDVSSEATDADEEVESDEEIGAFSATSQNSRHDPFSNYTVSADSLKIHRKLKDMLISSQNRAEAQTHEHKNTLRLLQECRENAQLLFEEDPTNSARQPLK